MLKRFAHGLMQTRMAVPGAGHWLMAEDPAAKIEAVQTFLAAR